MVRYKETESETGGIERREQDRTGTRERQCLKLNKTGPYPEEVTAAKDRDKDRTVPHGHDYMCSEHVYVCVYLQMHKCVSIG